MVSIFRELNATVLPQDGMPDRAALIAEELTTRSPLRGRQAYPSTRLTAGTASQGSRTRIILAVGAWA
jgi:hypothetical protein